MLLSVLPWLVDIHDDVFLHVLHHSCGVSSSKATDAKVIIALRLVQLWHVYIYMTKCESVACLKMRRGTHSLSQGSR